MSLSRRSYELMVRDRDLPWLLQQWVCKTPEKTWLVWTPFDGEHKSWTYAEFDVDVRRVAAGLKANGISVGERVFIHLDNSPDLLLTYFACALLGAVAVLGSTRSTRTELAYYLQITEPKGIVTHASFVDCFVGLVTDDQFMIASGRTDVQQDVQAYGDLLSYEPVNEKRSIDPMLDLRIQFTSGTTARPKAVLSTHANALFAGQQTAYAYNLQNDDVCQVFVPLYHNNGLTTLAMSTLWSGGTILLQPKFSASKFWGAALKYGATWASLPGAFFINALVDYKVPEHKFRFWFTGVAPEVEKRFNVKTRGHWGMSEMISIPLVGDPFHEGEPYNIGRPAPGNEIAVLDDQGRNCDCGETGRLFVRGIRGITLFKEYYADVEATNASFVDGGWFDTGDMVTLGENGNIYFSSRAKDVLRVGGENVAAAEIEAEIMRTGWVEECAVVGRPDTMLGEVPVAFVVCSAKAPEDLPAAIITRCSSVLADFKVLREVRVVKELPRSALNKIAKHKLRESIA